MRPTRAQAIASDPQQSVWVSASAGTGKTRVLVSRLLRLLLAGNRPEKMLCITFTKAAAAEVLQRIQKDVLEWSISDEAELKEKLVSLLDRAATEDELNRARRLLPMILQVPGGMKIMTIHAFCQSVLARFPLEAEITPGFKIIDEAQSQTFLTQAKNELLEQVTADNDPVLFADIARFFDRVYEGNQNDLIQSVLFKRYRLATLPDDIMIIRDHLCRLVGITPSELNTHSKDDFFNRMNASGLRGALPELFGASQKTLQNAAAMLEEFLTSNSRSFSDYKSIFLTKTNTIQTHLANGVAKLSPATNNAIMAEAERCVDFMETQNKIDLVKDSFSLLHICLRIMQSYQKKKKENGVLDYEDQILLTSQLLQDPSGSQWVHYKLDGGIDHILVDEAQDTSPAQWAIIKGITEEFFSGNARQDQGERTLFVVGDEKQSIFSFQNADPVAFSESRRFFKEKSGENKIAWEDLSLSDNFRSAPLILKLTDQVFSTAAMARHISEHEHHILHNAFHATRTGSVDIWPLIATEKSETQKFTENPVIILANQIADAVQTLLNNRTLRSDGQIMRPGDIMVLVRTRDPLVSPLTKAFKDRNIPVSSADRLVLNEQLAVQDCLVAMQAALHPQDDYALACFQKSPFIGMDEQTLYTLCYGRDGSVYERLRQSPHTALLDYLTRLTEAIRQPSVGHFIHTLLAHPCPADTRSGRHALVTRLGHDSEDILDELLSAAYAYCDQPNPTAQNFLTWIQQSRITIKRTGSDADLSRVRIMTAHAAKGLQAPYVFLADAHSRPSGYKSTREVLWLDDSQAGFLWGTSNAGKDPRFLLAKEQFQLQQFSEYYRLLYVALTRAEEHLVICGIDKNRRGSIDLPSWYEAAAQAVQELKADPAYQYREENGILHLLQHGADVSAKDGGATPAALETIPERLLSKPPAEPDILRPLRPSRPKEDALPVFSPLFNITKDPYRRGQVLHTLFRLIPDYPQEEQEDVLRNLLQRMVTEEKDRVQMADEVLSVIRDKAFSHLFTPQARAEVPVVGEIMIDGEHYAVSGQIDRLLVTDDHVLIVDYKTNRPPVLDEAKIPAAYRHQLRAYKLLMEKIYPGKSVETALLWTSVPALLKVGS